MLSSRYSQMCILRQWRMRSIESRLLCHSPRWRARPAAMVPESWTDPRSCSSPSLALCWCHSTFPARWEASGTTSLWPGERHIHTHKVFLRRPTSGGRGAAFLFLSSPFHGSCLFGRRTCSVCQPGSRNASSPPAAPPCSHQQWTSACPSGVTRWSPRTAWG